MSLSLNSVVDRFYTLRSKVGSKLILTKRFFVYNENQEWHYDTFLSIIDAIGLGNSLFLFILTIYSLIYGWNDHRNLIYNISATFIVFNIYAGKIRRVHSGIDPILQQINEFLQGSSAVVITLWSGYEGFYTYFTIILFFITFMNTLLFGNIGFLNRITGSNMLFFIKAENRRDRYKQIHLLRNLPCHEFSNRMVSVKTGEILKKFSTEPVGQRLNVTREFGPSSKFEKTWVLNYEKTYSVINIAYSLGFCKVTYKFPEASTKTLVEDYTYSQLMRLVEYLDYIENSNIYGCVIDETKVNDRILHSLEFEKVILKIGQGYILENYIVTSCNEAIGGDVDLDSTDFLRLSTLLMNPKFNDNALDIFNHNFLFFNGLKTGAIYNAFSNKVPFFKGSGVGNSQFKRYCSDISIHFNKVVKPIGIMRKESLALNYLNVSNTYRFNGVDIFKILFKKSVKLFSESIEKEHTIEIGEEVVTPQQLNEPVEEDINAEHCSLALENILECVLVNGAPKRLPAKPVLKINQEVLEVVQEELVPNPNFISSKERNKLRRQKYINAEIIKRNEEKIKNNVAMAERSRIEHERELEEYNRLKAIKEEIEKKIVELGDIECLVKEFEDKIVKLSKKIGNSKGSCDKDKTVLKAYSSEYLLKQSAYVSIYYDLFKQKGTYKFNRKPKIKLGNLPRFDYDLLKKDYNETLATQHKMSQRFFLSRKKLSLGLKTIKRFTLKNYPLNKVKSSNLVKDGVFYTTFNADIINKFIVSNQERVSGVTESKGKNKNKNKKMAEFNSGYGGKSKGLNLQVKNALNEVLQFLIQNNRNDFIKKYNSKINLERLPITLDTVIMTEITRLIENQANLIR